MACGQNLLAGKKRRAAPDLICGQIRILARNLTVQPHHMVNWHVPHFSSDSTLGTAYGRVNQHGAGRSVLVVIINMLLVLESNKPNYILKVQTIYLRYQGQVHVLCLEAKLVYNLILIQGPEFKCRSGSPSQRLSQA